MLTQTQTVHDMPCLSQRRYEVLIDEDLLEPAKSRLPELLEGRQALVVTTPTVRRLYGHALDAVVEHHRLRATTLVLRCSEQAKSLKAVQRVCRHALERGLGRDAVLVSVSGGVCSDIVTVAASLIRRGISHLRIPTTLIGQVDAGVGVKGAVNFAGKKSFLGCFYPPKAVLIDPHFLRTVPVTHLRYGLAEILKMAIIRDAELFDCIANHWQSLLLSRFQEPRAVVRRVLYLAAKGMLDELQPNLYEDRTYKRLVDAGHTFSPILEAVSSFSLHHGEAVAVDLALSATIAHLTGRLGAVERERIVETLAAVGLPVHDPALSVDLCLEALRDAARHRAGAINLVVPVGIGRATFIERAEEIEVATLREALRRTAMDAARHSGRWRP